MRKPDLEGFAQAWALANPDTKTNGEKHSTVRQWLVKGKFHAFWDTWVIGVMHLRDIPGVPPAHKESPEMTHEFIIFALDPGRDPKKYVEYDPDNLPFPVPHLEPIDCVVQFKCESDVKAADVCDAAVQDIIAGNSSPDQDFRAYWKKVIPATASCTKHADKGMH